MNETPPGGVYRVTVSNRGDLPVEGVEMSFPQLLRACVFREGQPRACAKGPGTASIGDLRSGQDAALFAWTASAPSVPDYESIRLTHRAGRGEVTITPVAAPPGFWDKWGTGLIVAAVIFVAWQLMIIGERKARERAVAKLAEYWKEP